MAQRWAELDRVILSPLTLRAKRESQMRKLEALIAFAKRLKVFDHPNFDPAKHLLPVAGSDPHTTHLLSEGGWVAEFAVDPSLKKIRCLKLVPPK